MRLVWSVRSIRWSRLGDKQNAFQKCLVQIAVFCERSQRTSQWTSQRVGTDIISRDTEKFRLNSDLQAFKNIEKLLESNCLNAENEFSLALLANYTVPPRCTPNAAVLVPILVGLHVITNF